MKLRLVKMTDSRDFTMFYQIQRKTFFFGWLAIGNRNDDIKSTFNNLEEAQNHYNAHLQKERYKTQVIETQ
jgi:hypothetical protein